MKKWKRTVVYGLLTVMAVGCVGVKAYPVMARKRKELQGDIWKKRFCCRKQAGGICKRYHSLL